MSFEFRRTLQKKKKKKLRRVYCKNKQTKKTKKRETTRYRYQVANKHTHSKSFLPESNS